MTQQQTLIIAEIGSSHNGELDKALALIDAAALSGANYAKFQLFTGDDLWHLSDSRLEATRKVAMPEYWVPLLMRRCVEKRIVFLCTPFSPHAVEFLQKSGVTSYKIASGDITYIPLLEAVAKTNRLVFLSVGASDFNEIDRAVSILKDNDLIIMHCVPEYPSVPGTANVRRILDLTQRYSMAARHIPVGVSSHMREWWVDTACILYRAYAIEKHIDLEGRRGPEGPHSLDPDEFAMFVAAVRDTEKAMEIPVDFTNGDRYARTNYRRNPKDWLRPHERK